MTIGKLSGQCDFGQKGQSYCNQRGQSCVAKRVKVAWLFQWVTQSRKSALPREALNKETIRIKKECIDIERPETDFPDLT